MNETLIGGKWEMSVGNVLIPASLLGDLSPNYAEGIMTANTQAGIRNQPSGMAETAELTGTIYVPNYDLIGVIFGIPEGQPIKFGGGSCKISVTRPINVHQVCDGKDGKNDIHMYSGLAVVSFNPTLSTSDLLGFDFTIQAQPTNEGYFLLGHPDPENPTYWDVETQTWLPVPTT